MNGKLPRGPRRPRGYANGGQEFGELKATVNSMSKTLDEFREETHEMFGKMEKAFETYEKRLSSLEKAKTYFAGAIGATTLIGIVVGWLIKVLTQAH